MAVYQAVTGRLRSWAEDLAAAGLEEGGLVAAVGSVAAGSVEAERVVVPEAGGAAAAELAAMGLAASLEDSGAGGSGVRMVRSAAGSAKECLEAQAGLAAAAAAEVRPQAARLGRLEQSSPEQDHFWR